MLKRIYQSQNEKYTLTYHDDKNDPDYGLVNITKSLIMNNKSYIVWKSKTCNGYEMDYLPKDAILKSEKISHYKPKNIFEGMINYEALDKALEDPEFIRVINKIKATI